MRYTDAFISTLTTTGQAILRKGPRYMGKIPFFAGPSGASSRDERGITFDAGGATPASTANVLSDPAGTEPTLYFHQLITSGDGASETAGLFGLPSTAVFLTAAAGFVVRNIVALNIGTTGRGGILAGEDFAVDFEPDGVIGGFGWTKGSGDAATLRWYAGTPGSTVALTGTAPTDGRRYDAYLAVEAGSSTGYALLIDLSDPDVPVIADERTFTVPSSSNPKGLELNASPGPAASGQPAVTLRFYLTEGSIVVTSLTN